MKLIETKFDFEITEDSDILIARNARFESDSTIDTIRMMDYMLSKGHKFLYHDRSIISERTVRYSTSAVTIQ